MSHIKFPASNRLPREYICPNCWDNVPKSERDLPCHPCQALIKNGCMVCKAKLPSDAVAVVCDGCYPEVTLIMGESLRVSNPFLEKTLTRKYPHVKDKPCYSYAAAAEQLRGHWMPK